MDLARTRDHFRRHVIPPRYSARAHIVFFCLFELVAIFLTGSFVDWSWRSPVYVLLCFAWATTFVYLIHRFTLHRKVPGFGWAFRLHHWHHAIYLPGHMQYEELNDVYMLLMPPWIQGLYFFVYLPALAVALSFVLPLTFIFHLLFALTLWYALYEAVHWVEHLSDEHPLSRFKIVQGLQEHHVWHHHPEFRDHCNFGIVEPSHDYLWGTKR